MCPFFLVSQNLYYRILTIKLVNQKRNYDGDSRDGLEFLNSSTIKPAALIAFLHSTPSTAFNP